MSNLIRFWEYSKKTALIPSALITAVIFLTYIAGPISTYETNDDVYHNLILAGKLITSTPDAHVGNLNYVLSSIFSSLYTYVPDVPWYAYFHITSICSAVFFLNYYFSIARNNSRFFIRLVVSLATALPFLIYIQFTKTSLALAATGYLAIYLLNETELRSRRQHVFLYSSAILFLVLSFSLRKDSFFLATLLFSLLIMRTLLKRNIAVISSLSVVVALITALGVVHTHNFGAEWQKVSMQWKKVIGPIIDYDLIQYDENQDVFSKAGWSRNDYYFLKTWAFVDKKVYGQKQIEYIYEHARRRDKTARIIPTLKDSVEFPGTNYILTTTGLSLLLLLIYRHRYHIVCIHVFIPFITCIGILAWQGRFPTRVSTAIAYCLPWLILAVSGEYRKRTSSALISFAVLLILSVPVYGQYLDLAELSRYRRKQNLDLHRLGILSKSSPFTLVTWGPSFPYEAILPFESPDYLSGIRAIWLSSMNQSPLQKKQMIETHITDIFDSLTTGKKVVVAFDPALTGFLKKYMIEHYQKEITVAPVYTGMNFSIYQLISPTLIGKQIQ